MNNEISHEIPLVTVITPVYNAEKFISDTINCVRNQTYHNWEMILVDDVSSDSSVEIIKDFMKLDNRIKLIQLQENSGAAVARNTAIEAAGGRYIAFLDSDDLWYSNKLERQIQFMQDHGYAFTFTGYRLMSENGELLNKVIQVPKEIDYNGYLKNTIIGCLTVILDTEQINNIKMKNIRTRQDFVLWLSILKRGFKAYGLQEELASYRKVSGSISSNKWKTAKRNWKVYREIEELSFIKSLYCFTLYAYNGFKKS